MKRCPECRRDYYDDSLVYCLDDGVALLEGPASEEGATAILHETDSLSEAKTKAFEAKAGIATPSRKWIIAAAIGIVVVAAIGVGGYFYYGRVSSKQIDSIAVMPFVNESGNPDVEYLFWER